MVPLQKEAISIAYLRGALQSYPAMTSELTLRNALETMLRSLPSSSLVPLLVLKHQANALQLAQARMLSPSTDSPSAEWQALMRMLSSSLLLISFQVCMSEALPSVVCKCMSLAPPRQTNMQHTISLMCHGYSERSCRGQGFTWAHSSNIQRNSSSQLSELIIDQKLSPAALQGLSTDLSRFVSVALETMPEDQQAFWSSGS